MMERWSFDCIGSGYLDLRDLMEQFELSANQASVDPKRYIGFAPGNMVYDWRACAQVRGSDYAVDISKPDVVHGGTAKTEIRRTLLNQSLKRFGFETSPTARESLEHNTLKSIETSFSASITPVRACRNFHESV